MMELFSELIDEVDYRYLNIFRNKNLHETKAKIQKYIENEKNMKIYNMLKAFITIWKRTKIRQLDF